MIYTYKYTVYIIIYIYIYTHRIDSHPGVHRICKNVIEYGSE